MDTILAEMTTTVMPNMVTTAIPCGTDDEVLWTLVCGL